MSVINAPKQMIMGEVFPDCLFLCNRSQFVMIIHILKVYFVNQIVLMLIKSFLHYLTNRKHYANASYHSYCYSDNKTLFPHLVINTLLANLSQYVLWTIVSPFSKHVTGV